MNDEGAMRVLDRVTHHAKQAQPRLERKTLRGAPFVDRDAVDELHHQIRRPIGREAAVEQGGDVGMGQAVRAPVVRCESARWRRGRSRPDPRILTATSCRYWPSARSAR